MVEDCPEDAGEGFVALPKMEDDVVVCPCVPATVSGPVMAATVTGSDSAVASGVTRSAVEEVDITLEDVAASGLDGIVGGHLYRHGGFRGAKGAPQMVVGVLPAGPLTLANLGKAKPAPLTLKNKSRTSLEGDGDPPAVRWAHWW